MEVLAKKKGDGDIPFLLHAEQSSNELDDQVLLSSGELVKISVFQISCSLQVEYKWIDIHERFVDHSSSANADNELVAIGILIGLGLLVGRKLNLQPIILEGDDPMRGAEICEDIEIGILILPDTCEIFKGGPGILILIGQASKNVGIGHDDFLSGS